MDDLQLESYDRALSPAEEARNGADILVHAGCLKKAAIWKEKESKTKEVKT
jgi:hypothetical protein